MENAAVTASECLAIGAGTASAAGWDGAEAEASQQVEQRWDAPAGKQTSSLQGSSDAIIQQSLEIQLASKMIGTAAGANDALLRP